MYFFNTERTLDIGGSPFIFLIEAGTDVMILIKFSQKNLAKESALLTQIKGNFSEKIHWFLRKTPIFSPKIGKNSRKL
jgi:hypothetical protein